MTPIGVHMDAHIHGCANPYVHTTTRMHTSTCAYTCSHLHRCTHPHVLTHAHTYTDAHIHTHSMHTPTWMHTSTRAYTCSHLHGCTYPHVLTCAHTYMDAHMHTHSMHTHVLNAHMCSHLHGCTHPHTLNAHTYMDAHIHTCSHMLTPTRMHTSGTVYTHECTHSRPYAMCTIMHTLTCVCTHTLPSPGQRAGLGQTAVDRSGHCSLWFPTGAAFLTGGQGEPRDSSGSSALALQPSTCSHDCAIVRRSEGPPDALLSSLPQRGPPNATFPHLGHTRCCSSSHSGRPGPTAPPPCGPSELPGFHRVLQAHRAFVRETDKETGLAAAHGPQEERGQCGPRGPLRSPPHLDCRPWTWQTSPPPVPSLSPAPRRQDR